MSQESIYVGIDVSKEQVDVAVRPTGRSWSASYDGVGIDVLVAQLKDLKPAGCVSVHVLPIVPYDDGRSANFLQRN